VIAHEVGARDRDQHGQPLQQLVELQYAVSVAAPSMRTITVSLKVMLGGTEPLLLTLEAGDSLEETVAVYGSGTPLETTVIGENFNYRNRVEELPINDRTIDQVTKLAPNVTDTQTTPFGGSCHLSTENPDTFG
jgi:hypothetical protein